MGKDVYILFADLLLVIHFLYVSFVVLGFLVIWIGHLFKWRLVYNFYFRFFHLVAIGVVMLQAILGSICPLTIWEDNLRLLANEADRYEESFVQHWLQKILYYEISLETFAVIYTVFFVLVLLSFWIVRPNLPQIFRRKNL